MTLGGGTESNLVTDVAFWVIAASTIIAAIAVVQLRDLFRAAMFLVVSFLGVAAMFVLLRAEFLAVVQILIYVGAISVLILFAILMTKDVERGNPYNRLRLPAGIVAVLFLLASSFVAVTTDWNLIDDAIGGDGTGKLVRITGEALDADGVAEVKAEVEATYTNTIPKVAELLLRDYVLAFEIASVLLLAAVIGSLVLVRER
jgi:NADH-quinone oxidoreductase subunit J